MAICGRIPSRFQVYGEMLMPFFLDAEKSPLRECQQEALQHLVQWFQDDCKKDSTAVVVMPTGSGKSGCHLLSALSYRSAISGGELSKGVVNIRQPVLVIAPGIDILNQLEKDLPTYFVRRGFLENVMQMKYIRFMLLQRRQFVNKLAENKSDNIILSNSQKWRHSRWHSCLRKSSQ